MGAMKGLKPVGLVALAVLGACSPSKVEEPTPPPRPDDAQQQVLTLKNATVTLYPGHCAGVIIADGHHALTAAHCIDGDVGEPQPVVLRDGTLLEGSVRRVDRVQDLAVIRLDTLAPVHPLELATAMPVPGQALLFAGRNDRPGEPQQMLLERLGHCPSLPGVPQALFTSMHGAKGDSGAPVVDEQLHVVGLVHGGAVCSIAAPTAGFVPVVDVLVAEVARSEPGLLGVGGSGGAGQ